jgi:hypothetical protein
MGYVGIHTSIQCRSLKCGSTNDLYHLSQIKTHCSSKQQHVGQGTPTAFQFDTFPTALQNVIGQGGKSDVRLAKRFVREYLSKKVQFLQPSNDDMMKTVYAMAWKYMNYNVNEFSSIWIKVVLPTIKSEMNLLRSGYAVAIKNQVICSKLYILLDVHLLAID